MISAIEALNYLKRVSGRINGLSIAEARDVDTCLAALEVHLTPKPPQKPELVPAPALENNHYP